MNTNTNRKNTPRIEILFPDNNLSSYDYTNRSNQIQQIQQIQQVKNSIPNNLAQLYGENIKSDACCSWFQKKQQESFNYSIPLLKPIPRGNYNALKFQVRGQDSYSDKINIQLKEDPEVLKKTLQKDYPNIDFENTRVCHFNSALHRTEQIKLCDFLIMPIEDQQAFRHKCPLTLFFPGLGILPASISSIDNPSPFIAFQFKSEGGESQKIADQLVKLINEELHDSVNTHKIEITQPEQNIPRKKIENYLQVSPIQCPDDSYLSSSEIKSGANSLQNSNIQLKNKIPHLKVPPLNFNSIQKIQNDVLPSLSQRSGRKKPLTIDINAHSRGNLTALWFIDELLKFNPNAHINYLMGIPPTTDPTIMGCGQFLKLLPERDILTLVRTILEQEKDVLITLDNSQDDNTFHPQTVREAIGELIKELQKKKI